MSPLPQVNQFTPTTVWSTSVGNGIGEFYSNLHPVMADNVVYAADRAGVVKALNADDLAKFLVCECLGEKDGWFSGLSRAVDRSGGVRHGRGRSRLLSAVKGRVLCAEYQRRYAHSMADEEVAGEALSRPVVSDGIVLIHTSNGQLQALHQADGAIKWTVNG